MVKITLDDIGIIELDKKLQAKLNIKTRELFNTFSEAAAKLSPKAKDIIYLAIDRGEDPKVKKQESEIRNFFIAVEAKITQMALNKQKEEEIVEEEEEPEEEIKEMGFEEEEEIEEEEAEELKGEEMEQEELESIDSEEEVTVETVDEETGEVEGELTLAKDTDSKLVPIVIKEKYEAYYTNDGSPTAKEPESKGYIILENISEEDKLWDIKLDLEQIDKTSLNKKYISLQELEPTEKHEVEYSIKEMVRPELKVSEFISTINDPEIASYSLLLNAENTVYFKISIDNLSQEKLQNVGIAKVILPEFDDVNIKGQSIGEAEITEKEGKKFVLWKIEELAEEAEEYLELEMTVQMDDKDAKVRSGEIIAKYKLPKTFSGIGIDSFASYTNNAFSIVTSELEDEPNSYDCKFIFTNKSDYVLRLVNADVYRTDDPSTKYIDIDPNDIPEIAAKGTWESKSWTYTSEEGKYPKFKTKIEFFTVADHKLKSVYKLLYDDVELAVVAVQGEVTSDVTTLPSFKITPMKFTSKLTNTGGADINKVTLIDEIQEMYLPPNRDEIEVTISGKEMIIPYDAISVEPDDKDPTIAHKLTIELEDLKTYDTGALKPGDDMVIKYPVIAQKPDRETKYISNITITANTDPLGQEIPVEFDLLEITVEHVRHNIAKGRNVQALETEGEFEVILIIENLGDSELNDYVLTEKVPKDQVIWDVSHEPEVIDEYDSKVLKWTFEAIAPNTTIEIKYKTKPAGETSVVSSEEAEL
jgi:hypothetical protein